MLHISDLSKLKKRLTNTLHPDKGFVKIYPSMAFLKLRPKWLLIVDFGTEKHRIEKNQNHWKVNPYKTNSLETKQRLFKNDEEVCIFFEEILLGVYRECIENTTV